VGVSQVSHLSLLVTKRLRKPQEWHLWQVWHPHARARPRTCAPNAASAATRSMPPRSPQARRPIPAVTT